jgi:hypothetical protein
MEKYTLVCCFYGCEARSRILREELRFKRCTEESIRPKRKEATRGWRKFRNELQDLSSSPNINFIIRRFKSRRIRWVRNAARMKEMRSGYTILTGNPEGKTALGRLRRRCEDNFKANLMKIECTDLAEFSMFRKGFSGLFC